MFFGEDDDPSRKEVELREQKAGEAFIYEWACSIAVHIWLGFIYLSAGCMMDLTFAMNSNFCRKELKFIFINYLVQLF